MLSPGGGREEGGMPLHGLWYRLWALADIGRLVGQWGMPRKPAEGTGRIPWPLCRIGKSKLVSGIV